MIFDDDTFKAVRILALKSVINPTEEDYCDMLISWYSRTYYTARSEVLEIPITEILRLYYIEKFENLKDDPEKKDEFKQLLIELTESKEQKKERIQKEINIEDEEDNFLKKVANMIQEQEKTSLNVKKKEIITPNIRDVKEKINIPEFPDVTMNFNSINNDDSELKEKGFGLLTPSKNRK